MVGLQQQVALAMDADREAGRLRDEELGRPHQLVGQHVDDPGLRAPPSNASSAPGPSPRSSADVAPSTPWPSPNAAITARIRRRQERSERAGGHGRRVVGIAYGLVGRSTSAPTEDHERVIHTLSSATDVMRSIDGSPATDRENPGGSPPGTQARNVAGASEAPSGVADRSDAWAGSSRSCSPRLCTASVIDAPKDRSDDQSGEHLRDVPHGDAIPSTGRPRLASSSTAARLGSPSSDRYAPPATHSSCSRLAVHRARLPSRSTSTW